jgi:hypothetical protein
LYNHPAEILLGFDLPCVKVLFDGQNAWMLKSARNAIVNRYNLATGYQPFRTGTYDTRLIKYFGRGFDIRVLNFQPERIDPNIYGDGIGQIQELSGLAKLLFMLKYNLSSLRYTFERLSGDYDPMANIFQSIAQYTATGPVPEWIIDILVGAYIRKPSFAFEIRAENWPRVFTNWSIVNALESIDTWNSQGTDYVTRQLKQSELAPIQFIGSLTEYLNSLPKMESWYCQAYGIHNTDCE